MKKNYMQYPPLMKSGSITKNLKKLYLFHHDYINDNDKWHDLKKEIERLIAKKYLQQFMKKEL
jgi:hypothetical protein